MSFTGRCPRCGSGLEGLATWCPICQAYTDDLKGPPPPSAPALDERSEAAIQLAIRRELEARLFHVYDLSQDRATRQTEGLADLYVIGFGRLAWVEVKTRAGKLRGDQKTFGQRVRGNGGEWHVWRHEDEAIAWAEAAVAGTVL